VALLGSLTAATLPGGWWTILLLFAAIMLSLIALSQGFRGGIYPSAFRRVFLHRIFWYAQISLLVLNLGAVVAFLFGLWFGEGLIWARRALAMETVFLAVLFFAGWLGSRLLVVREHRLRFPDLPPAFEGFTIAQLTDTHIGPHTNRRFLSRVREAVQGAKPDIVVFTGDQVDDYPEDVRHLAAAFADLPNAYAVLGNHDVYAGWSEVRDRLEQAGIKVLINDAVALNRAKEKIWLAGTGDPAGRQMSLSGRHEAAPDIPRTLARVTKGDFVVALAHNPALWPALAERGAQLTLSGHTHHGQFSVPWLKWCLASPFLEFAMGLYERPGAKLYVAPGTNFWGLPLRLGAWPEVTVVRLARA
jgi:predicted MPP superfamily phosphohydrolase